MILPCGLAIFPLFPTIPVSAVSHFLSAVQQHRSTLRPAKRHTFYFIIISLIFFLLGLLSCDKLRRHTDIHHITHHFKKRIIDTLSWGTTYNHKEYGYKFIPNVLHTKNKCYVILLYVRFSLFSLSMIHGKGRMKFCGANTMMLLSSTIIKHWPFLSFSSTTRQTNQARSNKNKVAYVYLMNSRLDGSLQLDNITDLAIMYFYHYTSRITLY